MSPAGRGAAVSQEPHVEDLPLFRIFASSLAVGLLMGLERERHPGARAGLRTFAFAALLGTLCALVAERSGSAWLMAAGLAGLAAMMVAAHWQGESAPDDPGTTTTAALLLCYLLGATLWFGYTHLVVALALTATALLHFKAELQDVSRRLSREDLVSFLQFAVIALIVLPLLPDRGYGPYAALNPHQIWLMVVLISGLSLAGYAALRLAGPRAGSVLAGLLGGLVSSTATTLVHSRHARADAAHTALSAEIILLANLVVVLRIALLVSAVAPAVLGVLWPALAGAFLSGGLVFAWRRSSLAAVSEPVVPSLSNPAELRVALGFGLAFALVLLLSAWLNDLAGARGVYAVALVAGLTDVDAISLSSLQLFKMDQLSAVQAATVITLALAANLGFKLGLAAVVGGNGLLRHLGAGFAALGAGLLGGWLFLG